MDGTFPASRVSQQAMMWLCRLNALVLLCIFSSSAQHASKKDYTPFVDPFIGTQGSVPGTSINGGNVFPGAVLPFGVVKVGIDTTNSFNQSVVVNAGYTPDGNVTAISMLHESGTGGAPTYGVVGQMPLTTLDGVNVLDNLTYMQPRTVNDTATVGYYKTSLANGVTAEMTASQHAGLMQYFYPPMGEKHLLVDLSHYLPNADGGQDEQQWSNGAIELSDDGQTYKGYGVWRGGWARSPSYRVFFCGEFDTKPSNAQLFRGSYTDPYWPNTTFAQPTFLGNATQVVGGASWYEYADRIGATFQFPSGSSRIKSKVGVSWVSVEKACAFREEISRFDMNSTIDAAKVSWNRRVLSKIDLGDTKNETRRTMFYSALYKSHLMPSNRTGENPHWFSSEPYYDDYYTAWDTFRCLNSLYLLLEPEVEEEIVRSLIDIWRHERFMPDGRSANYNGKVQGGSNADNILADGYVKGLRGAIDWNMGYSAMKTDAEVVPANTFDPDDLTQSTKEGRGSLKDWLAVGYTTPDYGRPISETFEYSLNDFALSQVAKDLATHDYKRYLYRSAGWQRFWRQNITSLKFAGFPAPVYRNGTVQSDYDPLSCGECEWTAVSYEALPWEYAWTVPFDMTTLIGFMGGPATMERRLDTMFIPGLGATARGPSSGSNTIGDSIFNPGNEPSFATPFLYNYLRGRQHKSVRRSREIVNQYYNENPSGLPGNSDAGALDSWMLWNMIGLYPVATQDVYLILAPWFDDITLNVGAEGSGKKLRVTAQGLSDDSYYVQSLKLNGKPWEKSWLRHEDLVVQGRGGRLDFVLGNEPADWDSGEIPPSPGHVEL